MDQRAAQLTAAPFQVGYKVAPAESFPNNTKPAAQSPGKHWNARQLETAQNSAFNRQRPNLPQHFTLQQFQIFLSKGVEKNAIKDIAELPTTLHERGLLYFSGKGGHARFVERLAQPRPTLQVVPEVLFDRRVYGCWDKYCRVWRVLFKSDFNNSTALEQFLFKEI
ncbi:MAG: hypothetical protein WCI18_12040 [Pseudomonadota bacterium]